MLRVAASLAALFLCAAVMPASAEQTDEEFKAACKPEYSQGTAAGDACVVNKMNEEADRINKLATKVAQQLEEVKRQNRCSEFIVNGLVSHRFTKEQVVASFGGDVSQENFRAKGCEAARSLGF